MRSLFSRSKSEAGRGSTPTVLTGPKVPRRSSGWDALLKHLEAESSLRILDIGPTSPNNINFLTNLGHSVFMADLVHEALGGDWMLPEPDAEGNPRWDVERYLDQNLDFQGRMFDVVLLWTTLGYLPEPLIEPVIRRLHASMNQKGRVLAFFHSRSSGEWNHYCRFNLTGSDQIELQQSEDFPLLRTYTNRAIEKLFQAFSTSKFFLAKDNLYEVLITR